MLFHFPRNIQLTLYMFNRATPCSRNKWLSKIRKGCRTLPGLVQVVKCTNLLVAPVRTRRSIGSKKAHVPVASHTMVVTRSTSCIFNSIARRQRVVSELNGLGDGGSRALGLANVFNLRRGRFPRFNEVLRDHIRGPRLTTGRDRDKNDADVSDEAGHVARSREKSGHWPDIGGTVDPVQRLLLCDDALRRRHSDVDVVVVVKMTRRRAPEPFLMRAYQLNRFPQRNEISRRKRRCYGAKISSEFARKMEVRLLYIYKIYYNNRKDIKI